jgi:streptogramin lyase
VDNKDIVWLSDFGANATLRFDPKTDNSPFTRALAATRACA